ncbi:hypothetical protein ACGF5C_28435 [Micromonospora sp. NPDC047620]|uniref:hypothetical protein n=1 Tax=Micromonospora sp. NPDC047620 TaxID=3364251 RepID=UPI00372274BC
MKLLWRVPRQHAALLAAEPEDRRVLDAAARADVESAAGMLAGAQPDLAASRRVVAPTAFSGPIDRPTTGNASTEGDHLSALRRVGRAMIVALPGTKGGPFGVPVWE